MSFGGTDGTVSENGSGLVTFTMAVGGTLSSDIEVGGTIQINNVDLTIVDVKTGEELDMGSAWDFFGTPSHPDYPNLNKQQRANRLLLRNLMLEAGFNPYEKEWWHFTLSDEPFPNTYFNFPVR